MSDIVRDCLTTELRIAQADLARTTARLATLESELDVAGECLCDALTYIAFIRQLIPAWKSAPVERMTALQGELADMREEMSRFLRAQMS